MKVSKIILLLIAFTAGIAGAFFYENLAPAKAGGDKAVGKDDPKGLHTYFSPDYNKAYPLTAAEYRELLFTTDFNCEEPLTEKLMKISLKCYLLKSRLEVVVGTVCQPGWNMYRRDGKWAVSDKELCAAYTEAAEEVLVMVHMPYYFPKGESGLTDDEITVKFLIQGEPLGEWRDGEFTLVKGQGQGQEEEVKSPLLDNLFDDMKFENAPTLGPVARKYFFAMFKGEWEKVWDMMPGEIHEQFEMMWETAKSSGSDEEKEIANKAGSAKEFYVLFMKENEKSEEEWAEEIAKEEEKIEVTGEEFSEDGKTGWIKAKNLKTGVEEKMFRLIKEGGKWKIG